MEVGAAMFSAPAPTLACRPAPVRSFGRCPRCPFAPQRCPLLPAAGGNVGLMGAVAETVAAGLGEENVIGVIPSALAPREVRAHCCAPEAIAGTGSAVPRWAAPTHCSSGRLAAGLGPPCSSSPQAGPTAAESSGGTVGLWDCRSPAPRWARSGWWTICTRVRP